MLERVSNRLRTAAAVLCREAWADQSDSPFQNGGFYTSPTSPSDPGSELMPGPLSVYNDADPKDDRIKVKEDVRRQGPRPLPSDRLDFNLSPTQVTVIEDPKTDVQGQPSDNVKARGMGEAGEQLNRETWRSEGPGGQLVQ